jgi:predicted lipoprotein with Yx(FWY)xxD motif
MPVTKPVPRRLALTAALAVALVPALVGAAPVSTPPPAGPPFTVAVVDTDTQGRVLSNPNGLVLYHFDGDQPSTDVFGCTGRCLTTHRPLLTTHGTPLHLPPGVPGTLGATERPDGVGDQVTYDGAPLYTYTGDRPGDTNGVAPGWHTAQVPHLS